MPSKPLRYLSAADVLRIHQDTLEHEGGIPGIRDMGLLESAVATPRQKLFGVVLHPDLASKAAAYLYHIARNQPFVDGNERAATMATLVFLHVNGAPRLPERDVGPGLAACDEPGRSPISRNGERSNRIWISGYVML